MNEQHKQVISSITNEFWSYKSHITLLKYFLAQNTSQCNWNTVKYSVVVNNKTSWRSITKMSWSYLIPSRVPGERAALFPLLNVFCEDLVALSSKTIFLGSEGKSLNSFWGHSRNSGFTCSGLDSLLSRSLYRQAPLTLASSQFQSGSFIRARQRAFGNHTLKNVKSLNFSRNKNPTVDGIEKQSRALASARWRSCVLKRTVVVLLKPCKLEQWHLLENHWVTGEGKVGLKSATHWTEAAQQQPAPFAFQIAGPHSYEFRLPPLHFFEWPKKSKERERLMRTAAPSPSLWQKFKKQRAFYM